MLNAPPRFMVTGHGRRAKVASHQARSEWLDQSTACSSKLIHIPTVGRKPLYAKERVALVHSRFRRIDRERHEALPFGQGDRIGIATQTVEAGVDVSARLLVTELAPWSSLVQRIGRCNRRAEFSDAEVLWVDIEPDAKGELLRPYTQEDLDRAREALGNLTDRSSVR